MKYHFSYLCEHKYKIFICCSHEIHLQGNLAEESFYQEKESKLLYSFYIPFNEQQKCHVTNIYTERKNKSIILHSFARKTKVSYYITFFQTLLKTFSYGLCCSDGRIILSYCKKRKVNYYVCRQEEQYIPFNEQRKCHVTNIYTVLRGKTRVSYYILLREKQKYHITSRSSKLS